MLVRLRCGIPRVDLAVMQFKCIIGMFKEPRS
jgi:hypothetical protein